MLEEPRAGRRGAAPELGLSTSAGVSGGREARAGSGAWAAAAAATMPCRGSARRGGDLAGSPAAAALLKPAMQVPLAPDSPRPLALPPAARARPPDRRGAAASLREEEEDEVGTGDAV